MHLEILVEEPSAKEALDIIVKCILGRTHSFVVHPFNGKPDLLKKLPSRLRGYRHYINENMRIVVLIDADEGSCLALKRKLDCIAHSVGLTTKTDNCASCHIMNRIVVKELEAWFWGDIYAVNRAYPRIPVGLVNKSKYRNPDAIGGGTCEALEREFKRYRIFTTGLPKREVAKNIAMHMLPERNTSPSFKAFVCGLQDICQIS